ncbi:hypothetical protein KoxyNG13_051920 [Klebsiella pasteurii]
MPPGSVSIRGAGSQKSLRITIRGKLTLPSLLCIYTVYSGGTARVTIATAKSWPDAATADSVDQGENEIYGYA